METTIKENLEMIKERIDKACKKSNRHPSEVQLLLATKTVEPENIRIAMQQGETLFGENKVQEGLSKQASLKDMNAEWHFIGHLQTNKIKDVIKWATCIHSIDNLKLAEKLNNRLKRENKTIDILIQVNTSNEESKFGVKPEDALTLAKEISEFGNLNIKGLMTIGLFSSEHEKVRSCFRILKQLQKELTDNNISADILSMGMSNDLEIAIEEGATLIRIGTAVFGDRKYPDSYYWPEALKD